MLNSVFQFIQPNPASQASACSVEILVHSSFGKKGLKTSLICSTYAFYVDDYTGSSYLTRLEGNSHMLKSICR
jgi:hypothetical protein